MKKSENGSQTAADKKQRVSAKSYLSEVKKTIQRAQNRIKNIQEQTPGDENTIQDSKSSQAILDRVGQKAYELFEKRGYHHGNDVFDWLEAERLLRTGQSKTSKRSKAKKAISSEEREGLIRQLAFEIYQKRGCVGGNELFDWLEAEKIIDAEYA